MTTCPLESVEERLSQFCQAPLYLSTGELTQTDSSYKNEQQLMQQAVAKRKREFFSGRYLARQALKRAGMPLTALPRAPLGNPIWPSAAIGSITHDQKYGAAIVARQRDLKGIGIDLIENPHRVDQDIAHMFLLPSEEAELKARFPNLSAAAVAFSVKESVVKAISGHLGRFIDLLEIHLTVTEHELAARVPGLQPHIPCIVLITEIGLLSASYFPHQQ